MEATSSRSAGDLPPAPKIKRTRRSTARSRQGCARCKARRMKCDESWPACQNCVKAGCRCPGLQKQFKWSNKHERFQTTPSIETHLDQINSDNAPYPDNESRQNNGSTASLPRPDSACNDGLDSSAVDADLAWLNTISSFCHDTAPCADADAQPSDDTGTIPNPFPTSSVLDMPVPQYQYDPFAAPGPASLRTPVHLPTALIEYWFRSICPMRSTFDSDINYNRQLASGTWTTSQAVFYTMQAMSAACIVDSLPQLSDVLPSFTAQATAAIKEGISQVRTSLQHRVTADLVFAVFSLGTSLHWTMSTPLENAWLESAHELLITWGAQLSPVDAPLHAYFCQALTYWEMLLAAIGRGSIPARVESKRRQYQGQLRRAIRLLGEDGDTSLLEPQPRVFSQHFPGALPNSWCGLSSEVIDVFGQVLALCRSTCQRDNESAFTVATTSNALCDISVAHDLQKELLAMDFSTLILIQEVEGFPVHTRDEKTPISHLLQTAEAYRQAGLLQLHLVFSDLAMTPLRKPNGSVLDDLSSIDAVDSFVGIKQSREDFLLKLTLQLVSTLEQIPAESGSRSIHPMLYISAAAGLRFDRRQQSQAVSNLIRGHGSIGGLSTTSTPHSVAQRDQTTTARPDESREHTSEQADVLGTFISQSTMEVARARRLVWTRLSSLQHTLPHRASDSMPQLVKAMWRQYDTLQSERSGSHWLDILKESGSEILFF